MFENIYKKVLFIILLCMTLLLTACGVDSTPDTPENTDEMKSAEVGEYITFGKYEGEAIEWLVLEKQDEKMLVISRYTLESQPYHDTREDITWQNCTLRKWLNVDFLNAVFAENEQAMISAVTVPADKNPKYDTNPGNATQDKVFLLSIAEVEKYFNSDDERACTYKNGDDCYWWLRSPGLNQSYAAYVINDGGVLEFGDYVNTGDIAVRPALWIDLNSTLESTDEMKSAEVGKYITFGKYEGEAIEWLVLEKTDEKMLVISRYALEARPYHDTFEEITWEDCTLRKWLNEVFLSMAFTEEERAMIPTVSVRVGKNNTTQDKIFLLSVAEAEKYFDADYKRACTYRDGLICWWWLRSTGDFQDYYTAYVRDDGGVVANGLHVNNGTFAVRPALWIEVDT